MGIDIYTCDECKGRFRSLIAEGFGVDGLEERIPILEPRGMAGDWGIFNVICEECLVDEKKVIGGEK